MTVTWDGKVTMCCKDINLEYEGLGDLTKDTVLEAWRNFERNWLRYLHFSHKIEDLPCASCYFPYFNQHGKNYMFKGFMKEFWDNDGTE